MRFELSIRRRKASVGSRCRRAVTVSGAQIIMHHEGRPSVPGFLVFSSTPDEATTNSRCRITNEELPSSLFVGIKPAFRFACSPCGVNSLRALPCRNLLADSVLLPSRTLSVIAGKSMQEYDKSSKWLIQHHGDLILRLAGICDIAWWKPLQAEIVQSRRLPDGLIEAACLGQKQPDLFILEIATYPDARVIQQVSRDVALVYLDRDVLPEVLVLFLQPAGRDAVTRGLAV
jgi:hypothetical protein